MNLGHHLECGTCVLETGLAASPVEELEAAEDIYTVAMDVLKDLEDEELREVSVDVEKGGVGSVPSVGVGVGIGIIIRAVGAEKESILESGLRQEKNPETVEFSRSVGTVVRSGLQVYGEAGEVSPECNVKEAGRFVRTALKEVDQQRGCDADKVAKVCEAENQGSWRGVADGDLMTGMVRRLSNCAKRLQGWNNSNRCALRDRIGAKKLEMAEYGFGFGELGDFSLWVSVS
ncbi:hypothetical protein LWI29_033874 [Acer saccharum]|uniref:Uncharacterized protein n=1 Tax=Acer saccharum TaxID=4024 RepID=A0AA39VB76_ACESA|nr:hypothetical protein LWI29_033874 [Acer saccharum]